MPCPPKNKGDQLEQQPMPEAAQDSKKVLMSKLRTARTIEEQEWKTL